MPGRTMRVGAVHHASAAIGLSISRRIAEVSTLQSEFTQMIDENFIVCTAETEDTD